MTDLSKVVPATSIRGEDEEDTRLLNGMLGQAVDYLTSFRWCLRIVESYFGLGVGGVVAVFLFRIEPGAPDVDEWVWVITGDLPPAYITVEDSPNPASALDAYIGGMQEWVEAAAGGRSVDGLIPVNVEPTRENADALRSRLRFVDERILTKYADDLKA